MRDDAEGYVLHCGSVCFVHHSQRLGFGSSRSLLVRLGILMYHQVLTVILNVYIHFIGGFGGFGPSGSIS